MTLYDRLAATPDGARRLAVARLRREAARCLRRAHLASELSVDDIASRAGSHRRDLMRALGGGHDISVEQLARYLHAMGYELELQLVPAGEPRRKATAWSEVRAHIVTDDRHPFGKSD
ncbi:helix-turn-helix domain-containing protein [Streptacidiphilus sp. PAMC 29251]